MKRKILFIQHASAFGGSAMSLLYMLQEIRNIRNEDFELLIALAKWTPQLAEFYEKEGFIVVKNDWIDTYEHTQGVHYNLLNPIEVIKEIKQLFKLSKSKKNTFKLLELVKPDIVHLNSVVLVGSALAVKDYGIPLVWHIREPSVKGFYGLRRQILIRRLQNLANKVFFICKADMASWGNPSNGEVVYNFVDFKKFDRNLPHPFIIGNIAIPQSDLTVLFLGALGRIKGGLFLVKAINTLMQKHPNKSITLLFPGGIYDKPNYLLYKLATLILPLFGLGTYSQRIEIEIRKSPDPKSFIKFRFVKEVPDLFAASDVLVFPSTRPHFARPVIEAGAMAKPAIASRLGGVTELIEEGKNGFFVRPKDEKELFDKLDYLLKNKEEIKRLGENGYKMALKRYQASENIRAIINAYDSL